MLVLFTNMLINAQTIVKGDLIINSSQEMGQIHQQTIIYTGDLIINGTTLNLTSTDIIIRGNILGYGYVVGENSTICYEGKNKAKFDIFCKGVELTSCSSLNNNIFDINRDFGFSYEIYNENDDRIKKGYTDKYIYEFMPYNEKLTVRVNGFKEYIYIRK